MDRSRLIFCARQILIHWIQSGVPLERVVAGVFKETSLGTGERKILQERIFTWARYWPLFSEGLDLAKVDSAAVTNLLMTRIEASWDLTSEHWQRRHQKQRPLATEDLRRHLLLVHGVNTDLMALFSDTSLESFHDYLHASLKPAPLAIRCRDLETVNKLRLDLPDVDFVSGAFSELCLKSTRRWPAQQHPLYLSGHFEIQDESSQLVSLFCDPKPGMKILDLCAGAGGKSLHLAQLMDGRGEIHCWDPAHKKLQELQKRARRWGYTNLRCLDKAPQSKGAYDLVLIDAPCSSLGTLRRRPQLLASTSQRELIRLQGLQRELLIRGMELAQPGGTVVYATCSPLPLENYAQVRTYSDKALALPQAPLTKFLQSLRETSPSAKISTIPESEFGTWCAQISAVANFDGDGFFVARLKA